MRKFSWICGAVLETFYCIFYIFFKIFLNTKTGFQNRELHFKEENIKIMASCKPVYNENALQRVIIFFDDIAEVKKTAYKVLGSNTMHFDSIIGDSI